MSKGIVTWMSGSKVSEQNIALWQGDQCYSPQLLVLLMLWLISVSCNWVKLAVFGCERCLQSTRVVSFACFIDPGIWILYSSSCLTCWPVPLLAPWCSSLSRDFKKVYWQYSGTTIILQLYIWTNNSPFSPEPCILQIFCKNEVQYS